jgi:hypothetical protein
MGPHEPLVTVSPPKGATGLQTGLTMVPPGCWLTGDGVLETNPLGVGPRPGTPGGCSRERLAGGISPGYSSDLIGRARIC